MGRIKFEFFKYPKDIKQRIKELKTKQAFYWENEGKKYVDKLVKFVINTVPAYQKFLKDHSINYKKIKGLQDFNELPITDKFNYLKQYPYEELFPYKNIVNSTVVLGTSGTTGEPFYFPRKIEDHAYLRAYLADISFNNQWDMYRYNNLIILGFGLGIWVAGVAMLETLSALKRRGYNLTIIPTGVNKESFLKSFKKFSPYYNQIILMGYPPFIKDILDEGERDYGINWRKYRIKIFNTGECFPEEFREYIGRKAGLENILNDNINNYGSAELGGMALESSFSNLIRHVAIEKDKVFRAIFHDITTTPTLAQFHPYLVYFEEINGEVIATGYSSAIPLIRYRFPDRGGVISFNEMIKRLKSVGVDVFKEAERWKINKKILRLPFVYIYERSDFAVSLVGILIYPEYIRKALHSKKTEKFITGKATMTVKYDKKLNQYLEINVELQKNVKPPERLVEMVKEEVLRSLLKNSTEYNHLYSNANPEYKKQLEPKIILWSYGHEKYFSLKGKHKWSIKQI